MVRPAFYVSKRLRSKPFSRKSKKRTYFQAFKHYAQQAYNTAKQVDNAIGQARIVYDIGKEIIPRAYKWVRRQHRRRRGLPRYHDEL